MADSSLSLPTDLGTQIQGLLSQFQPSQQMLDAANQRAKLDFFLGLLGAPKGGEFQRLGQSGMNALAERDNYIKTQQGLAAQNMQLAMPLIQLAQRQQFSKAMSDILNGNNQETQAGPPASFQQPGGASSLMNGAMGNGMPPQTQLPTQVTAPVDPAQQFNKLNKLNLQGMMLGMPDMAPAINAMYPAPTALRPNAAAIDRFGRVITPPMPVPPAGSVFDPTTGSFKQVPNAPEALALPKVTANLANLATSPQVGVLPGGGEGVVGTKLGALGGAGGQYSFLNNVLPQSQPGTAPAAPTAPTPVQTKLSPEQEKNSAALGEDLAGYREQVSKSSNALAQLNEISSALNYFKPGPTLPMRAAVAGYAQEIPGVGRTIADQFVPNSAAALPAIAAMEKIGVGLTAEQSKVFGSREGQQVIGMIKSAMPNAEMVPGAPQIIVDAMKGMHQWSIDKGMAAQAWIKDPAHHGSLDGFSTDWDSTHPVSSYVGNLPALSAIAKGMPPTAVDRPQSQAAPAKTVVRTGTFNGKRVVQYSDGSVSYTQ